MSGSFSWALAAFIQSLCPQAIREEYLLTGSLEASNRPYALAKIADIEMCWSFNRQFGTKYLSIMPTNLYGANDNYDPQDSHLLQALIRKVAETKKSGRHEIAVWGTGTTHRELLYGFQPHQRAWVAPAGQSRGWYPKSF